MEIARCDFDVLHQAKAKTTAPEGHLEGLRAIGSSRVSQTGELELAEERRKAVAFIYEKLAIADSC